MNNFKQLASVRNYNKKNNNIQKLVDIRTICGSTYDEIMLL